MKKRIFLLVVLISMFGQIVLADASTVYIDITDFKFNPMTLNIAKGTTVTWTQKDSVQHTVTATYGENFDSGNLNQGQTFSYTFNQAGKVEYGCTNHPSMTGSITVDTASPSIGPTPTSELTIISDSPSVQVGISKGVTFYVEKPGTVSCMALDCPEPEPAVPISGANVILGGVATESGSTDGNGNVIIYVNANSAGTIYVTASKSGYTDGSTTLTAEYPPTPIPPTPDPYTPDITIVSATFNSDKNMYIRGELVYLTITNTGEDAITLSESNKVNWKIVSEIYESGASTATGDIVTDDANAVAISESTITNTKLFPGSPLTVPWDQRDRNGNLVGQGRYKGCVKWSYNGQYHESCTAIFEIVVPVTPTPTSIPTPIVTPPSTQVPSPSSPTPTILITGPTVNLRSVDDDITIGDSGLIELYMDNPLVNDETMYADVKITVPEGINVYALEFVDAGAAGVLRGTFEIPPGNTRMIKLSIKPEKAGNFLITFSGIYWHGEHKDDYQPISLSNTVEVSEYKPTLTGPTSPTPTIGGFGIIYGTGILMISYVLMRKKNK